MDTAKLISQALETRDSSLARVEPALEHIPETLPKNVTKIANEVLTAKELEITALDAPEIIKAIREKVYSCEEVTRAFLRRAALAQKLVSGRDHQPNKITTQNLNKSTDKLHHRAPSRASNRACKIPRLALQTSRPASRPPHLGQRAPWHERLLNQRQLRSFHWKSTRWRRRSK